MTTASPIRQKTECNELPLPQCVCPAECRPPFGVRMLGISSGLLSESYSAFCSSSWPFTVYSPVFGAGEPTEVPNQALLMRAANRRGGLQPLKAQDAARGCPDTSPLRFADDDRRGADSEMLSLLLRWCRRREAVESGEVGGTGGETEAPAPQATPSSVRDTLTTTTAHLHARCQSTPAIG